MSGDGAERLEREADVFDRACELPAEERAAYLDRTCAGDDALRRRVDALLAADERDGRRLDRPAVEGLSATDSLPARIGSYRVLGLLGSGGMGVVYEAEQDSPARRVALKVLRPGLVTESLLRRFEHEARVLGWLNHAGIAQIYEAGTARSSPGGEAGPPEHQPYFAMELVRGVSITRYAEQHGLDVRARLELLARVCDAVEHAHQKGVIHRDLKPGNVLVDGSGQPKVLDFGVARVTEQDLTATTAHTRTGELIGTVAYMSPEQVGGRPEAVDTRSDIYALGVIAHELLAGAPPLDLREKLVHEAVRAILEDEPSSLGALDAQLRGDVETIVAKSLEKERERRYPSAEALASDIRRFLDDQPIEARPASAIYQLRKFTRRNRTLVGAALGVLVALLLGAATSTVLYLREQDARARAEHAEVAALASAERASDEAEVATEVKDFLLQVFNMSNPLTSRGEDMTVADVLDRALEMASEDDDLSPRVHAEVISTIALTYQGTSRLSEALELMEQAAATARSIDDPAFAKARVRIVRQLGRLYQELQRLDDARATLDEAHALALEHFGEGHASELRVRFLQGSLEMSRGDFEDALPLLRGVDEVIAARGLEEDEGDEGLETRTFVNVNRSYLAFAMGVLGDSAGAVEKLEQVVAYHDERELSEDPRLIMPLGWLASSLREVGRRDEARTAAERALSIAETQLPPGSFQLFSPLLELGDMAFEAEEFGVAEDLYARALEVLRANERGRHLPAGQVLVRLARLDRAQGREAEAFEGLLEALDVYDGLFGPEHPSYAFALEQLRELLAREPVPDHVSGEAQSPEEQLAVLEAWLRERGHGELIPELRDAIRD